eukprot:m.502292 g.502292  ORF g.502292 m.502292 type:complete len:265 (+) comp21842_c1_seq41:1392-2186(+)
MSRGGSRVKLLWTLCSCPKRCHHQYFPAHTLTVGECARFRRRELCLALGKTAARFPAARPCSVGRVWCFACLGFVPVGVMVQRRVGVAGRAVVVAPVSREMDAQVAVVLASEHRTVTGITDSGMSPRPYSAVTKSKCPIGYFSPCAGCNAPTVPLVGVHSHSIDTVRQACASETAAVVSAGWCWLVLPACANVCWYVRAVVGWKRRKMVEPFYLVRYTTDPKHRTGPVYGMMGSRCVLGNRLLCALEPPLVDPGQSVSVWYMMS